MRQQLAEAGENSYPKRSDKFDFSALIEQANKKREESGIEVSCQFCRNNSEPKDIYRSHSLKDSLGRVTCPILKSYACPICGASGELSHTLKYCPTLQKKSKLLKIQKYA